MKVPIDNMTFAESEYLRGNKVWKAQTLYNFAKAKEYPVRDMPLWNIDLTVEPFECSQLHSFIFQCKRVRDCSLDYPIILDEVGQIADGYHRLSVLLGSCVQIVCNELLCAKKKPLQISL